MQRASDAVCLLARGPICGGKAGLLPLLLGVVGGILKMTNFLLDGDSSFLKRCTITWERLKQTPRFSARGGRSLQKSALAVKCLPKDLACVRIRAVRE